MADESRKQDPELLAMSRIGRVLEDMNEGARGRVLFYLVGRWAPPGFSVSVEEGKATQCPKPSEN
jgi:hypothetical protein